LGAEGKDVLSFIAFGQGVVLEEEVIVGEALHVDLTGAVVEELLQLFDTLARASGDEAAALPTELRPPGGESRGLIPPATGVLGLNRTRRGREGEGVDLIEDEDRRLIDASVDLTQRRGDDLDMLLEVGVGNVHHV